MRNIDDYEKKYLKSNFERKQEYFRRIKVKECIDTYCKCDNNDKIYHILEIGCGVKPLFVDYDKKFMFYETEPAEQLYQNANKMAKECRNAICFKGFFENYVYELKKYTFDMIICSGLLHEVEDPYKMVKSIKSLCQKNTVVHFNVPNAMSFHRLLAKEMGIIKDLYEFSERNIDLQQNSVFDKVKLERLISKADFQIVDSGSYFVKPFTHAQMQKCIEEQIIDEKVLEGLYKICNSYLYDFGSEIYVNAKI